MIAPEIVERVRESADLVQIVGEHVELKRQGSDWRGPCPFHHGENRNFSVSPRKQMYYCFVCHESGDVFGFLMKHLGMDFTSAVRRVAEDAGIEIPADDPRQIRKDPREPHWEVLGAAADWYRTRLWEDPAASEARDYLAERQIPRPLADRFQLGFAPRDGELLRAHLRALGMDDERQLVTGLLVKRDDETSARPRFRGRLMFPILDGSGRTVGFGGRVLGQGEPKYLNSPETPVFSKGRLLYGMQLARPAARKDERILVVEGYFDAIRVAGAGIESVVAPMGTALTADQAELLARLTTNVFLLYDSDEAGLKATFRSGLELLRLGVAPRVVSLPDGEDPDSFARKHGGEGLERQLSHAVDVFERQLQILERKGWFADLHRRRRAIDKLLPTIRATSDPLTRELYLGSLAERAKVDRDLLAREAAEPPRRAGGGVAPRGPAPDAPVSPSGPESGAPPPTAPYGAAAREKAWNDRRKAWERLKLKRRGITQWMTLEEPPRSAGAPGIRAERNLVLAMLHRPETRARISESVSAETFHEPRYAELFDLLSALDGPVSFEALAEELSEESVAMLEPLIASEGELQGVTALVDGSLRQLRARGLQEQEQQIVQMLEGEREPVRREALSAELKRITDERRSLRVKLGWFTQLGDRAM